MKTLYKHQERFLKENPNSKLLLWEAGSGKTLAACEWLKLRTKRRALVVAPKAIQQKWKNDLLHSGAIADVVTTDGIKKISLKKYSAIVIDEAHNIAAPIFTQGRSNRVTVVYNHIRDNPDTHVLLLTATPVRSQAWNIHTLGTFVGHYWNWKQFRNKFYTFTDRFGRWHYEPKSDWRKGVRPYIEEISDIVLMSDIVEVPQHVEEVINIPWGKSDEQLLTKLYQDVSKEWHT